MKPHAKSPSWDAVLASSPLNREAATVTSESREEHGFWRENCDQYHQDAPHELMSGERLAARQTAPTFSDLTGQRFNRFVVRGIAELQTKQKGNPLWAVRCDCGAYTLRRSKALRCGDHDRQMCAVCDHLNEIRRGKVPGIDNSNRKRAEVREQFRERKT
ncbi:hypothetical protein [Henriciella aquimarina]|uniref:hypothetical protein n=1 Tax=Henriciella aquimarina TaxID=545261 RepID=UPI000A00A58F|nr:hypothetical protein [Henriciella aquimarina]